MRNVRRKIAHASPEKGSVEAGIFQRDARYAISGTKWDE